MVRTATLVLTILKTLVMVVMENGNKMVAKRVVDAIVVAGDIPMVTVSQLPQNVLTHHLVLAKMKSLPIALVVVANPTAMVGRACGKVAMKVALAPLVLLE